MHPLWRAVFGNSLPVEIEIGPGRGDVLLAFAGAAPHTNFFAIEYRADPAAEVAARVAARGFANVRVIAGDARCVITQVVPDASVAAYHVYFPDPWPKTRHRARRLLAGGFARELARSLVPGGALHLATDLPHLLEEMATQLTAAGFVRRQVPGRARPATRFERKYGAAGTHAATFVHPADR